MDKVLSKEEQSFKDNIRGAIIFNSMGTWENMGKTLLDEVDLDEATDDIYKIVLDYISNQLNKTI